MGKLTSARKVTAVEATTMRPMESVFCWQNIFIFQLLSLPLAPKASHLATWARPRNCERAARSSARERRLDDWPHSRRLAAGPSRGPLPTAATLSTRPIRRPSLSPPPALLEHVCSLSLKLASHPTSWLFGRARPAGSGPSPGRRRARLASDRLRVCVCMFAEQICACYSAWAAGETRRREADEKRAQNQCFALAAAAGWARKNAPLKRVGRACKCGPLQPARLAGQARAGPPCLAPLIGFQPAAQLFACGPDGRKRRPLTSEAGQRAPGRRQMEFEGRNMTQ